MDNQMTKKKPRKLYDLSELEKWLEDYEKWYKEFTEQPQTQDSGTPSGPPPPPPGGGNNP